MAVVVVVDLSVCACILLGTSDDFATSHISESQLIRVNSTLLLFFIEMADNLYFLTHKCHVCNNVAYSVYVNIGSII